MILLPFTQFTIETELSIEQAMKNLISEVDTSRSIWNQGKSQRRFWGKLSGRTFRIQRSIKYQNSFLPVIVGKIEKANSTEIKVFLRPSYYTTIFMIFWLSFTGFGSFNKENFNVLPIMFFFGLGLLIFGFGFEAKKAEKELMRIFDESNKSGLKT
jgi:hypothetical protein